MVRESLRKLGIAAGAARDLGADLHGVAVRAGRAAAAKYLQPYARNPGGHVLIEDREPPGRAVERAREDRRISLSTAEPDRGDHLLQPSVGRGPSSPRDGVEGRASRAADPIGHAFI